MAKGQERERVKELSYDYVSDEEDSTDGKWVVRKPSWRSQEADRISQSSTLVILFIFLLESLKAPRPATTDKTSLKN